MKRKKLLSHCWQDTLRPQFGKLAFLAAFFLTGISAVAQVGTTCENPIVITALPYTTTDDTADYADNYDPDTDVSPLCGEDEGNYYHGGNDVIYAFTPATDMSIDLLMPDVVGWTGMFVYTDCDDIGVEYAACSASSDEGDRAINDFLVTGGQTYYILLSTWPNPQTFEYTLNITQNSCLIHAVDFDVVSNCENVAGGFFVTADISSLGSAGSLTVTDNQGSPAQEVDEPGLITFGPYEDMTEVVITVENDDDDTCSVTSEELIQLGCAPANDDCSDAVVLTVNDDLECGTVTAGTTVGASESMEADPCYGNPDDDVWFSFEATQDKHVITLSNIVDVTGEEDEDLYFEVLNGACGTLENMFCSDDEENTVEGLAAGETYYVRVYSYYDESRQTFDICIGTMPPPPANDECGDAPALTVGTDFDSAAITVSNVAATHDDEDPEPDCDNSDFEEEGNDIWFTVTVPETGTLWLETRGNGDEGIEDTGIAAYSGTCGDIEEIDCDSDTGEGNFSLLALSDLEPGTQLLVRVWGYAGDSGSFDVAAYTDCDLDAPDGDEEQTLAAGQTLADLDVTGTNLTWYSDEALTSEIPATTVAVDGTTYYVTQTEAPCVSDALAIEVAVVDPCAGILVPGGNEEQTLAPGQTLADLDVTGEDLTWYSDEALTSEIPATTVAVDGTTYYVTQTVGECTSDALAIEVAVVDPCAGILEPVGNEEQTLAPGQTLADLDVTGEDLTWYSDEALTSEIPATTVAVDGTTYYVTQTVGECTSDALAIEVAVVDPCAGILTPVGNEQQTLEPGQTLADLDVTGEDLTWYSDEALTSEIPATTVAVDGTVYYVTQTVGECTSNALAIEVSVVDPCADIEEPAGNETQDFTEGETLADLDVTGENLIWYADEALTTVLPATTVLTDDTTYYVTQTVGECTSDALEVTVNLVLGTDGFDNASFRYYPNPVNDVLNFSYASDIDNVTVYNMLGQPVLSAALNAANGSVDMSRLQAGSYLVKVSAGNAVKTIKIVKQ